jgi:hypothetical protein
MPKSEPPEGKKNQIALFLVTTEKAQKSIIQKFSTPFFLSVTLQCQPPVFHMKPSKF